MKSIYLFSLVFLLSSSASAEIKGLDNWPKTYQEIISKALADVEGTVDISTTLVVGEEESLQRIFSNIRPEAFDIVFPILMKNFSQKAQKSSYNTSQPEEKNPHLAMINILEGLNLHYYPEGLNIAKHFDWIVKAAQINSRATDSAWSLSALHHVFGQLSNGQILETMELELGYNYTRRSEHFLNLFRWFKPNSLDEVQRAIDAIFQIYATNSFGNADSRPRTMTFTALTQNPHLFESDELNTSEKRKILSVLVKAANSKSSMANNSNEFGLALLNNIFTRDLGFDISSAVKRVVNFNNKNFGGYARIISHFHYKVGRLILNPSIRKIDEILLDSIIAYNPNHEYLNNVAVNAQYDLDNKNAEEDNVNLMQFLAKVYEADHLMKKDDLVNDVTFAVIFKSASYTESFLNEIDSFFKDRTEEQKAEFILKGITASIDGLNKAFNRPNALPKTSTRYYEQFTQLFMNNGFSKLSEDSQVSIFEELIQFAINKENRKLLRSLTKSPAFRNPKFTDMRVAISLFLTDGNWAELKADLQPKEGPFTCKAILTK